MRFGGERIVCAISIAAITACVVLVIVVVLTIENTNIVEIITPTNDVNDSKPYWGYQCINKQCVKTKIEGSNKVHLLGKSSCALRCYDEGTLWPKPIVPYLSDKTVAQINPDAISILYPKFKNQAEYWTESEKRFTKIINSKIPSNIVRSKLASGSEVIIQINVNDDDLRLSLDTDELYTLNIQAMDKRMLVFIGANTYYGARHGLESVSQLIVYDEVHHKMNMLNYVDFYDYPYYPYRGLLVDTVRHYYSIEAIKRTIDAMALVKLNVFHWHITDSQSFPLQLRPYPELSKIGAYAPEKIYSVKDIEDVVKYARIRGVQVVPEFDAPAHVGEGWQYTDLITCFDAKPWQDYCVGPPCGQFDVTKDKLYDMLHKIYQDMNHMFDFPSLFHMGGDEVKPSCWNKSESVQKWMTDRGWNLGTQDFINLWSYFQDRAGKLWTDISPAPIILWTSTLTDAADITDRLNTNKYIIHIWTNGDDPTVNNLLTKGYKLIMSNADRFYLDCGFGSWVNDGNTWCSPYKGWHRVYDNNLKNLAGNYSDQILGGEACLWSSVNDEFSMDSRVWPRASALAERLWAEPVTTYKEATNRMLLHRESLIAYGIQAETIKPEWCLQNDDECTLY